MSVAALPSFAPEVLRLFADREADRVEVAVLQPLAQCGREHGEAIGHHL